MTPKNDVLFKSTLDVVTIALSYQLLTSSLAGNSNVEHIAQLAPTLTKSKVSFLLQCAVESSFLECKASKQKGLLYDD